MNFVLHSLISCFIINYTRPPCPEGHDLLPWKSYFPLVNSLVSVWFLVVIWVTLHCYFVHKPMRPNLKKKLYIGLIFFVLISAASKIYQYTIYILNYLQVEVFKRADQDQLKEIFSQVRTEFFFIVLWWIYLANGP